MEDFKIQTLVSKKKWTNNNLGLYFEKIRKFTGSSACFLKKGAMHVKIQNDELGLLGL